MIYIIHQHGNKKGTPMYLSYIFLSFIVSLITLFVTYLTSGTMQNYKSTIAKIIIFATIIMILGKGFFNNAYIFSIYLGGCIAVCFMARFITKRSAKEKSDEEKEKEENECKVKYPD